MAKKDKKKSSKGVMQMLRSRTTYLIIIILVIGFGAITSRLAYLQTIGSSYLQEKAVEQQLRDTTISAKRGTIYDADGNVLAQSATVWNIFIDPLEIDDEEERILIVDKFSELFEYDDEERKALYEKTKAEKE